MTFWRSRLARCTVLAALLAVGTVTFAQAPPPGRETSAASVAAYSPAQQMPIDPDVVVGTLPNGLRYYVRPNGRPARRAELRLVVKAGSVLEDDDQQGVAHFVEHMEFEGTKHFPRNGIVEFLGSMGLGIGADANAATSYDDTQYTLRVPTDVPGALDRALLALEDWAGAASFDQDAVDRQRGIVLSEWRMNLGAGERTADKIRRVQLEGSRYAILTDKETTATQVELNDLRPARNQGSVGGYRDVMKDQLFSAILGNRLDELTQRENPPFIRAAADRSLFPMPRTKDLAALQALVANDGAARGLEALVTELQRVARFGFTATELERAKQEMMANYERVVTESPDRESRSRADEYTRNFLQDEALPTIWQELAFHRRFVPEITLREVNALTSDWFPEQNRLVIVAGPEAAGVVMPDQAQLAAAVKTAVAKKLEPYVDAGAGLALMDAPPPKAAVVKTTERPGGITEWTLSNGATVVMKPTRLKEDQILFRAFAPGGTSVASDAEFIAARAADDVVTPGGVGKFDSVTLDKILAGKAVAVRPYIAEDEHGMGGGSTPQDLETMFQLLHLRFTQPRADPIAFAAVASQARALLANRAASPDVVFDQTLEAALSRNSPRRQPETPATVDKWNLAPSLAFYKARFADASNVTFVFVGSFTPEMLKPFVETYLASLPATHARETWRDLGITAPTGVIEKTIEMGIAPKSQVAIVFSGPFEYDDSHKLALRTMGLLLQSRLFDSIRQELGGTYSITASPGAVKFPKPEYSVRIEWTCDPARTETLVKRVFEEIEALKGTYISREHLGRIRQGLLREYELDSQDNGYFLNEIAHRYADREAIPPTDLTDQIGALTGAAIQDAAKKYLDTNNYVKVTLMPAKK